MRRCSTGSAALPEPQQAALGVALGLSSGAAPDRFLVALAALNLLAEVAAERPLLCFVDDAQWLDAASRQVLGFVARRLLAESVALVFAARDPTDERELVGLPELALGGLDDADARALLATVIPTGLDDRIRNRLVAETHGNPLAILELPRGLAATQLPGGLGLLEAEALPRRIEESFLRQLDALPEDARLLLLLVAAEPVDDPLLVWRAAERLGIESAAADETEGLLAIGERVTFLHPLVRSAVYRSASAQERRAVHRALAEVTDAEADADRRAWHLAAAASGPNEEVASELERSAGRAQARGGLAAAAAFLRSSVALTLDPQRRTERALAAAQASLHAGAFDTALALLAAAESGRLDELGRARVDLLHAEVAYAQNRGSDAPLPLLRAATRLEPLDVRLSRDTYLDAWSAALFAGRLATAGSLLDVSRAVRTAPEPAPSPRPSDVLLDGFALVFTEGRPAATPLLQEAATAFAGPDVVGRGGAALGMAGHGGGGRGVGLRHLPRRGRQRGRARPERRRSRGAGRQRQRARPGRRAGGRLRPRRAAGRRGRRGHRGHRGQRRPVWRPRAPGPAWSGGRGIEAHRGHGRGGHRRRPGHRRPVRALGQRDPAQRARPLRRGPCRGRQGERRHAGAVRRHLGAERAGRGRRPERERGPGRRRCRTPCGDARRPARPTGDWVWPPAHGR